MKPDAFLDLQQAQVSKLYGKYRGTVVNNTDPQQMGRLQVNCPSVFGASTSTWAMPCVPYAGPGVGFFFLPPLGAGVWVEFEAGSVEHPIWSGCYWHTGELPPDAVSADIKLIVTDAASLKITDTSGEVVLKNQQNATITLAADVKIEAGSATHTVGAAGVVSDCAPGKVEVGAAGVTINGGAFKVS